MLLKMRYLPVFFVWLLGCTLTLVAETMEDANTKDVASVAITNETCSSVNTDLKPNPMKGLSKEEIEGLEALESLKNEADGAVGVEQLMKEKHNIAMTKILRVENWKSLVVRTKVPILGPYIKAKMGTFHDLKMDIVFKLLGKTGQVLRVAYAGCKEFECRKGVYNVMDRYQDLITESKRMSKEMVLSCIRAIKFHRYAYLYVTLDRFEKQREKSLKQLNRTIPIAMKIRNESATLADETSNLIGLSKNVGKQIEEDTDTTKEDHEAWKNKLNLLEEKRRNDTMLLDTLKNKSVVLQKNIQKTNEIEKYIFSKEQFEENKNTLSKKCEMVNTKKFEKVCDTVTSWWGWRRRRKCEMKQGFATERVCRLQVDAFLQDLRNENLRELAKQKRDIQNQRIEYQKQKLKVQLMQQEQFSELEAAGQQLAHLKLKENDKDNNLKIAMISLDLAKKAMRIVHMQLKKLEEFWSNIILHTATMIKTAADREGEENKEAALIEGRKPLVLESAFSWMALGNVLGQANDELVSTTAVIEDAFMRFPTSEEVQTVIEHEAPQILNATIALARSFDKDVKNTKAKIDLMVKCNKKFPPVEKLVKEYGDIDADDAADLAEMDKLD